MTNPSVSRARHRAALVLAVPALLVWTTCGGGGPQGLAPLDSSVFRSDAGDGSAGDAGDGAVTIDPNKYDILFMIDDSPSMATVQQKLLAQLPVFMQILQALPEGLPSIHIAVVSSDMGAPSDTSIGCSAAGDQGVFFNRPEGTCTATTLMAGATFISDDAPGATKNFELPDPAGLGTVFQCIGLLGISGCGFGQPLAAIDRALGADGLGPAPLRDQGFLRPDAYLAIVIISNKDDCSAPAGSPLYSLNGGSDDLSNPLGPINNYRCNVAGHLCQDQNSGNQTPVTFAPPPLQLPADATAGAVPTLALSNCVSNDTSGMLTPVSKFITDIKALKFEPYTQIQVAAVTGVTGTEPNATPTPYVVEWLPGPGSASNELWPQVEHVCGPAGPETAPGGQITTDGSFADPAVRISQFVHAFGANGVVTSICDDSFTSAFSAIAARI